MLILIVLILIFCSNWIRSTLKRGSTLSFVYSDPKLAVANLEGWMAAEQDFEERISNAAGALHVLDVEGYSLEFLPMAGSWFGNGAEPKL